MNLIPKPLLENYSSSIYGRAKLRLLQAVAGNPGVFPTKAQQISYFERTYKESSVYAYLIHDLLTTNNYRLLKCSELKNDMGVGELFQKMRKYPPPDALFMEIDLEEKKKVVAWLRTFAYVGNPATIYHLILYEDTAFPERFIAYYEFDPSDENKDTAITWVGSDMVKQQRAMSNWRSLNDPLLELVVGLLNFSVSEYQSTSISLEQIIENKWDLKELSVMNIPNDPRCTELLEQLIKGKIKLTIGTVALHTVRPYSYETCFKTSMNEIEFGLERIDDICLLVYYKDGQFISSDDYVFYMALRIRNLPFARVAVMGPVPEKAIKVESIGGRELLPNVHRDASPVSDTMSAELNEGVLDAFLTKLRIADRAGDWARIRCVVLTEDRHGSMLANLLESSGMHPDETRIMSYEGCTHLGSLSIIMKTLKQIKEDLEFVVHRDADYLPTDQLQTITEKIKHQGATALITTGTDIESYYLNAEHIHYLYDHIPAKDIAQMILSATKSTEQLSIERLRKQHYGKQYAGEPALNDLKLPATYAADTARYRYGKRTLGVLKSRLQTALGENPDLNRPSPFLFDVQMKTLAEGIWPDRILPWN